MMQSIQTYYTTCREQNKPLIAIVINHRLLVNPLHKTTFKQRGHKYMAMTS